MDNVALD